MSRTLGISFGNDTTDNTIQGYAISNKPPVNCGSGDSVFPTNPVVVQQGHNGNLGFTVTVNGNTLPSALIYTYATDTFSLFPDNTLYFELHPSDDHSVDVGCTYRGQPLDAVADILVESVKVEAGRRPMGKPTGQ